jgi:hypothetical protein
MIKWKSVGASICPIAHFAPKKSMHHAVHFYRPMFCVRALDTIDMRMSVLSVEVRLLLSACWLQGFSLLVATIHTFHPVLGCHSNLVHHPFIICSCFFFLIVKKKYDPICRCLTRHMKGMKWSPFTSQPIAVLWREPWALNSSSIL